jgi:hypothetical protein
MDALYHQSPETTHPHDTNIFSSNQVLTMVTTKIPSSVMRNCIVRCRCANVTEEWHLKRIASPAAWHSLIYPDNGGSSIPLHRHHMPGHGHIAQASDLHVLRPVISPSSTKCYTSYSPVTPTITIHFFSFSASCHASPTLLPVRVSIIDWVKEYSMISVEHLP